MNDSIMILLNLRRFNKVVVESITDTRYLCDDITVYTLIDTEISLGPGNEGLETFHVVLTLHYFRKYLRSQGVNIDFDNEEDLFLNMGRSVGPISDSIFFKAFESDIEDSGFLKYFKKNKFYVAYLVMINDYVILNVRTED